jgi:hypothetical protein
MEQFVLTGPLVQNVRSGYRLHTVLPNLSQGGT